MRNLEQDARAIAGIRVAAACSAMGQIFQYLKGLTYNAMRFSTLNVHDETDAAGVMFLIWIIQPLSRRQAKPLLHNIYFPS